VKPPFFPIDCGAPEAATFFKAICFVREHVPCLASYSAATRLEFLSVTPSLRPSVSPPDPHKFFLCANSPSAAGSDDLIDIKIFP
jgi:hypothetical protein